MFLALNNFEDIVSIETEGAAGLHVDCWFLDFLTLNKLGWDDGESAQRRG